MTAPAPVPSAPLPGLAVLHGDATMLRHASMAAWERPVPSCPGWDGAGLLGHCGEILTWAGTILGTGEKVDRADREKPPADRSTWVAWYDAALARVVDTLGTVPPDRPTWVFAPSGTPEARWWQRRLGVELAVHRWDAQLAADAACAPLDPVVAVAGVEEHLVQFLPGLLARHEGPALTGSLHLHADDVPDGLEWWVDLGAGGDAVPVPEHRHGDVAVRGTASDLLLWLTHRRPADALDVVGDVDLARALTALVR